MQKYITLFNKIKLLDEIATQKKDLAHIYDILGITGKADLKALFIGYKF